MRLKLGAATLTFVGAFALAACNDAAGNGSGGDSVEIEFDLDTKTKTVTVLPTLTPPPYRPASTVKTTVRPTATTKPRVTR